jgi:hypothetical protein
VHSKDLNAILEPGRPSQAFDLPGAGSSFHGNTPPPAFAPPLASSFAPPPPPAFAPPPPFSAAAVQSAKENTNNAITQKNPPLRPLSPPFGGLASGGGTFDNGGRSPEAMPFGPSIGDSANDSDDTRVVGPGDAAEEDGHFRMVYEDFLTAKRQCGESLAGLTLEKFKEKLRDNKQALISKHNCRTVRFSVYIKDGKAALKATPVRD